MHRRAQSQGLAALAFFLFLALVFPATPDSGSSDWAQTQRAELERQLAHATPGSARAFKLQTKIERIDAHLDGRPQPGFPDEYARFLNDRKIPSDRTTVEYEPGYQLRELQTARLNRRAPKAPLDWRERGPGNVAGRARGIIVDPDDPTGNTWFIASVGGGVWKTTDSGATWTELTQDVPNLQISCITMAPSDHDVIYAGTGESFFNIDVMNGNGIIKSTDRGQTWTQLASTTDDPRWNNVSRILVDPTDEDVVLASVTMGRYKYSEGGDTSSIFRSTDGGATWTEVHQVTNVVGGGGRGIQQIIADPTDFDVMYASVNAVGILKSTDRGLTWSDSSNGITDFTGRFELAISTVDTDYVFASAQGASHSELWVSVDGGANWFETVESGDEPNWLGAQGWYDNAIVCHPTDPAIVFVGGPELWQIDMGTIGSTSRNTTPLASYSFPHPDHHDLEIVFPQGQDWYLLGTSDGGVNRTAAFASGFTQPTDGMVTTQFYGVDKAPGRSAYAGGTQDNGTWLSPDDPDGLTPWAFVIGGDGYETSWHFDDPMKVIGGYQFNGLQRSLDGGVTWESATNGLSDTGGANAPFVTKIGKSQSSPDALYAVGANGVWRSTDFGGSWTNTPIPSGDWGGLSSFLDVRVSEPNPAVVWAGGRMDGGGVLSVSTDAGVSFSPTSVYPGESLGRISGLATHPVNPNTAFALFSFATRPKILRTDDLGATWNDITGFEGNTVSASGFPDVAVYDLIVFPNDTDRMWVGTEIGLVETLDGGATWALADNGLPSVGIWMLRVVEDEVVVATHGRGIWSVTIPELEDGQTFNPLLEFIGQNPSNGALEVTTMLRSAYDQTQIFVNGSVVQTLGANVKRQVETVSVPVTAAGSKNVFVRGTKDGQTYDSIAKSIDVAVLAPPVAQYTTAVDDAADFVLNGMALGFNGTFGESGLETPHPYPDGANFTAIMSQPIRVLPTTRLLYDEVAIVEPGDPGTQYGDYGFWDFCVVEATTDGATWTPLFDGYDARDDSVWENAYYGSDPGDPSMLRTRDVLIGNQFPMNTVIQVRFRFSSDGFVNSWGWWVDDVRITADVTSTPRGARLALDQNAPNPFNPNTTIAFSLPRQGAVTLQVFDVRGRLVRTLVDESRGAGEHRVVWDGTDDGGRAAASGVYLYRLNADGQVLQNKMTLVK